MRSYAQGNEDKGNTFCVNTGLNLSTKFIHNWGDIHCPSSPTRVHCLFLVFQAPSAVFIQQSITVHQLVSVCGEEREREREGGGGDGAERETEGGRVNLSSLRRELFTGAFAHNYYVMAL